MWRHVQALKSVPRSIATRTPNPGGITADGHRSRWEGQPLTVHEPIFSLPQPDADQVGVELMNPGHARHRGPWLTARRHDLSLEFVAVFTTCTAFDCTHENVHLEVKWASSGALKWGARWEDWPLTGIGPFWRLSGATKCTQSILNWLRGVFDSRTNPLSFGCAQVGILIFQ